MGHAGRVPHVQVEELLEDHFVQLTVLGKNERVVQAGDEQDVVDAEAGQVGEAGEFHVSCNLESGIWNLEFVRNLEA